MTCRPIIVERIAERRLLFGQKMHASAQIQPGPRNIRGGKIDTMNVLFRWLLIPAIAVLFASCAEPQKPQPPTMAAASGSSFNQVGKVAFYEGQPCTSQIVFVFRGGKSTSVPMAAPIRQSKIMTDAARRNRSVHVSGRWRRSKEKGCAYLEVTQVEMEKSFWVRTFGNQ